MKLKRIQTFADVEHLSRIIMTRLPTSYRFNLEISPEEAFNALYGALKGIVGKRNPNIELDEVTRRRLMQVADWVTDPNGKPTLTLLGGVGNGKTSMARALKELIEFVTAFESDNSHTVKVRMYDAIEICKIYAMCVHEANFGEWDNICNTRVLVIDDLGTEPTETVFYGTNYKPMLELLNRRYDRWGNTIITTNLSADDIAERYGARTRDRFKETAQMIAFTNQGYR